MGEAIIIEYTTEGRKLTHPSTIVVLEPLEKLRKEEARLVKAEQEADLQLEEIRDIIQALLAVMNG